MVTWPSRSIRWVGLLLDSVQAVLVAISTLDDKEEKISMASDRKPSCIPTTRDDGNFDLVVPTVHRMVSEPSWTCS